MKYENTFNFPNIDVIPLYEQDVLVGQEIKPKSGYVLTISQELPQFLKEGKLKIHQYFSMCGVGTDYDFSDFPYVAIPISEI